MTEKKDTLLSLRVITPDDYKQLAELMDIVYPDIGGAWPKVTIQALVNAFPDGQICIEDNGTGMDDVAMSRVFNPFYSTKRQGEGTGLGLSVSYGLARRYGGNITVQSSPGDGSCFTIWLLTEPELIEDEETIIEQLHAIEDDSEVARRQVS